MTILTDTIVDVQTGEVASSSDVVTFVANGIGSCIVFCLYDPWTGIGGMAHAMLPGRNQSSRASDNFRYAHNAIDELLLRMHSLGARREHILTALAGGGNVLRRPDDAVCEMNIAGARSLMALLELPIIAASLGGDVRRRVRFATATGAVYCGLGDAADALLAVLR